MADTLEAIYMFAAANKNLKFTSQVIKPLKVSSIVIILVRKVSSYWIHSCDKETNLANTESTATIHLNGMQVSEILVLTVIETNSYVYDFKGRVTEPSIKNFQMVPEVDGRRGDTVGDFLL